MELKYTVLQKEIESEKLECHGHDILPRRITSLMSGNVG